MPSGIWYSVAQKESILKLTKEGYGLGHIAIKMGLAKYGIRSALDRECRRREEKLIKKGIPSAEVIKQVQREIYGEDITILTISFGDKN